MTLRNDVTRPDLSMNVSTSAFEVQNILAKLDVNKETGPADDISAIILKECFRELLHPLSTLNMSFRLGVFPQEWKRANIIPVKTSDN